jgi:predicted ATP-grasp superfamily ATP-dependent carboligase
MPLRSRASFMDSKAVVIVAASGRALAASARRGGYLPLVIDWFGDTDTLALSAAHAGLADGLARGMTAGTLDTAMAAVTKSYQPLGIVCGTGFEDRPELLEHLAHHGRIFGCSADTVRRVKDPAAFAALCLDCAVPHPEISCARPVDATGWLAKRKGGAGGSHVVAAAARDAANFYYQRQVPGEGVSALFLANGKRALVLGFSSQWVSATPHQPFRYGGAIRPALLPKNISDLLEDVVRKIARAIPLLGLCSADFLVDGDDFRLLEVNPRPGATLDIFEAPQKSLFALHMAACAGELAAQAPSLAGVDATAIAYGKHDMHVPAFDWPEWSADRPRAGTMVRQGEPLCTILAAAAGHAQTRALIEQRLETILARTHARI